MCILGIFTIAIFNVCGVSVTKFISSLARAIVDVSRTVLVWLVALLLTYTHLEMWENPFWGAQLMEFGGFVVLVFGNIIFYEILRPFYYQKTKKL
jgi:hypothetical protein